MIRTHVGGERVAPLSAAPAASPASDLGEVRTQAAKRTAYTSAASGTQPGFNQF